MALTICRGLVKDVGSIDAVISAWDLGRGETEVINWAFTNPGWTPVLDDRAARKLRTFSESACFWHNWNTYNGQETAEN